MTFFFKYLIHRELNIYVNGLSQYGVDQLVNMKRLHTLEIVVSNWDTYNPEMFLTLAGQIPSLRNFGHRGNSSENQFVAEFGEKYPQKELTMDQN